MNNDFKFELKAIADRCHQDIDCILLEVTCYEDLLIILQEESNSIELRTLACWLLGRLNNHKAIPILLSILTHNKSELRQAAARALGDLKAQEATEQLIVTLMSEEDTEVAIAIVYSLGWLGDFKAFDILVSILEDQTKNTKIRGFAAEALGNLGEIKAVIRLIMALADSSVEVRFWAAFSLGALKDLQALPALQRLAEQDEGILPNWGSVRDEAVEAIRSIQESYSNPNISELE